MFLKILAFAGATLAIAAIAAGCGSSSSGSSASPSAGTSASGSPMGSGYGYGSPAKAPSSSGAVTVKAASSPLGTILVDSEGKTLYLFEADSPNMSNCSGGCTAVWPPVTTSGKATAGAGVSAGMLGTAKRSDGSMEVTYAGHPLYWFEGDTKAGDTNGEGLTDFGGAWYAVSPAGKAVLAAGS
jgi:predicted lipoprotein with Yx(FWY)xxD motif